MNVLKNQISEMHIINRLIMTKATNIIAQIILYNYYIIFYIICDYNMYKYIMLQYNKI